jgi:hypothetical protein
MAGQLAVAVPAVRLPPAVQTHPLLRRLVIALECTPTATFRDVYQAVVSVARGLEVVRRHRGDAGPRGEAALACQAFALAVGGMVRTGAHTLDWMQTAQDLRRLDLDEHHAEALSRRARSLERLVGRLVTRIERAVVEYTATQSGAATHLSRGKHVAQRN